MHRLWVCTATAEGRGWGGHVNEGVVSSLTKGGGAGGRVCVKPQTLGASLVVQWLRIHLPVQGTRVQALVREDPTCRGATKPVHHNY